VLTVLAFFGFLNIYALRVNLSVAVVAMVNHTALELHSTSASTAAAANATDQCGNVITLDKKKSDDVSVHTHTHARTHARTHAPV